MLLISISIYVFWLSTSFASTRDVVQEKSFKNKSRAETLLVVGKLEKDQKAQLDSHLLSLVFHDSSLQMVVVTDEVTPKVLTLVKSVHSASFREDLSLMLITSFKPVPEKIRPLFNKIIHLDEMSLGESKIFLRRNQHVMLQNKLGENTDVLGLSMQILNQTRSESHD